MCELTKCTISVYKELAWSWFSRTETCCQLCISEFYIYGSVHRDSVLISSNKMQQYAGIYLLHVYSTCFGRSSRPSSGEQKTVAEVSGTGHSNSATTCTIGHVGGRLLLRYYDLYHWPRWRNVVDQILWPVPLATFEEGRWTVNMTCTRGCSYSFMYSWWWARWTPETCRVILQ